MSKHYSNLCELRDTQSYTEIREAQSWMWIKEDWEAWKYSQHHWVNSHREDLKKYVSDFSVCVQAGGNMGVHPRLYSDIFERVYTFEPDPLNFFCLTLNCQKNNIIKMQAALGAEHKLITVNRPSPTNVGMHNINETDVGFIPMITLDSLNLDACSFIQLDVEFYELNIIKGALKTIDKFKPVITCELNPLQRCAVFAESAYKGVNHGADPTSVTLDEDIQKLLTPLGYEKVGMSGDDGVYKYVK
jgi:FkbM family methyltransferase